MALVFLCRQNFLFGNKTIVFEQFEKLFGQRSVNLTLFLRREVESNKRRHEYYFDGLEGLIPARRGRL